MVSFEQRFNMVLGLGVQFESGTISIQGKISRLFFGSETEVFTKH